MENRGTALEAFLTSPFFWGIVFPLVALALALSGKLDANAAKLVLFVAWLISTIAIYRVGLILRQPILPKVLWLGFFSCAIGLVFYYLAQWMTSKPAQQSLSENHDKAAPPAAAQGLSPRFSETFDRFAVRSGGLLTIISNINGTRQPLLTVGSDGFTGIGGMGAIGDPNAPLPDTDEARVMVSINDNQLLVDADVFTSVGEPPMRVRRNEISGRPIGRWDKQFSANALEIVNQDLVPVLQIIYFDNARVAINGVFINGDQAVILTDEETVWGAKSELDELLKRHSIKRLFKYPSWKYPGLFEN